MKKYIERTNIPWRLLAGLLLAHGVAAIYYILRPGNPEFFPVAINTLSILDAVVLGILCLQGSHVLLWLKTDNPASQTSRRYCPVLLGIALFVFAFAQVIWLFWIQILHQKFTFPSPQQFAALATYPFYICAILVLPARSLTLIARLRIFLDSLIIIAAVTTLCYYYLLAPILVRGEGTLLAKVMANIFPQADLLLLFCLLLVALRLGETALRPVLLMLGLSTLCLFIIHVAHLYEVFSLQFNLYSPVTTLFMLNGILMVGAAQTVRRMLDKGESVPALAPEKAEHVTLLDPTERGKALLPYALVLIFGLIVAGIWLTKKDNQNFPGQITIIYIGSFIVLLLMVLRQFLAVYDINLLQGEVSKKNQSLSRINEQLEQQAASDPLTGLPNHRTLGDRLREELISAQKTQTACSILFIDIDYFKAINDEHGHPVGDTVLCQFGELVQSSLRAADHVGRWGGEEFVAVLPGVCTSEALVVAERLRSRIVRQIFAYDGGALHLTCSLGIASYPANATESEDLITLADRAMYAAKRLGRNQTRTSCEPGVLALGLLAETPSSPEEINIQGVTEALLSLQEARNPHTVEHERRVSALSKELALALGLDEQKASIVSLGGLLHDLGKIALPDEIALKRGSLTTDEFHIVRRHPVAGAEILNTVPALDEVADIVRSHHEWVNGSGYPAGLQGAAIPLGARIVSVADAYDVITHARPYCQAHSSAEALRELQKSVGTQFDPRIVDTLVHLLTTHQQQPIIGVA